MKRVLDPGWKQLRGGDLVEPIARIQKTKVLESWLVTFGLLVETGEADKILVESLILAQDQRWRRA